jgi:FtsP/CotA-like multicopper oxidase with cupredoxin domain
MSLTGKIAAQVRRKALVVPAVILAAGTGALLPLGSAAADASSIHAPGTLTVATTGTDSGNCQPGPCRTLGYALTQAGPKDTIVIHPGAKGP